MTAQVVVPLAAGRTDELDTAAVVTVVRREGLDLRHRLFVAYVIDFGGRREDAYAAARAARTTEWNSALYGDASGWVLRLNRRRRLTRGVVLEDVAEVKLLAARCRGRVRSVTVEDLPRDDVWGEMAAQLQDSTRRREDETLPAAAVPAQRVAEPGRADL